MFVLFRALAYASVFIGVLLVLVPRQILDAAGIARPTWLGPWQVAGGGIVIAGAVLALSCVVTFALVGRGTPAPFDPPRRLVVAGPYRWVRNPMYIGAGLVLTGSALFYQSVAIAIFAVAFITAAHGFVLMYEEPVLQRTFGAAYADYYNTVNRWLPKWRS